MCAHQQSMTIVPYFLMALFKVSAVRYVTECFPHMLLKVAMNTSLLAALHFCIASVLLPMYCCRPTNFVM